MYKTHCTAAASIAFCLLCLAPALPADDTAKVDKEKEGWKTIPTDSLMDWGDGDTWWTATDEGILVAESDGSSTRRKPHYLIWNGRLEGDFEMTLEYRLISDRPADAGICLRVEEIYLGEYNLPGYQVELDTGPSFGRMRNGKNFGNLHDGKRGQTIYRNGRHSFDASGAWTIEKFKNKFDPQEVYRNPPEWNECRVTARGTEVHVEINGRKSVELVDNNDEVRAAGQIVALQFRPNQKNRFEVRNIRYRPIKSQ